VTLALVANQFTDRDWVSRGTLKAPQ